MSSRALAKAALRTRVKRWRAEAVIPPLRGEGWKIHVTKRLGWLAPTAFVFLRDSQAARGLKCHILIPRNAVRGQSSHSNVAKGATLEWGTRLTRMGHPLSYISLFLIS